MKKRVLSFILAVVLITSILPAFPALAGTAWDGSSKSEPQQIDGVYQISDSAQLAWFAEKSKTQSDINAVLTDDIDLGGKEWTPIGMAASGYVTESYSGAFDGQGHTVSGLYINTSSAFYGFFYCVYGGTVKNLNVIGDVTTTKNTAGGIVGKLQGGTVENCSFDGSVKANGNYVGGIVANIVTNSKAASVITGCCNSGEISGKYAGGILGYTTAKADINNCYNTGTINGTTRSAGISGQQTAGAISYCYNIGHSASGISGFCNASITNCYYLNDETAAPGGTATGYEKIADKAILLENLNAGESKLFCEDIGNKNNGYPVLNWQNKLSPEEEAEEQRKRENAEKVKQAVEALSLEAQTIKEECTLNLPSQIGDCTVEWSSDNTDIISDAGMVILPEKNIVTVTLTATVTCDTASDSKKFTINVWSENIDADLYLQTVLDAMQWNFKQLQPVYGEDTNIIFKFQNLLKSKGFDGVTVSIKSTSDESLISENGKIYYPVNTDNSYANGKQVQVQFNLTVGDKTVVYPDSDINSLFIPWNTSDVKKALESSADTVLNENEICNGNGSLDFVSSDLNLPSCIRGDKYSFAWITWESSDNTHLAISDENRQGSADALYNPYVGKVYQDSQQHTVVLTATITNPSTDVTVKRVFEVTVNPLTDEELNQSLDMMKKILNCYTADKLENFATKKKLKINAVDSDIQLVIPSRVVAADELEALDYGKYWDYWNYKFSVTSSDTSVIEINSFRAYVYRPLGEDSSADKNITLTVKMESKQNPNLFVTKDISVTIKHLSREDINNALDLMDQAKTGYAAGLLGNNTDLYSVIDDLTPYKEIVWNHDKSGVDFVYRHSDIKGSGIIVDELPGWEEQEDWRLFCTSNKDLVSNETLILNQTPDEDTFVKINSVLTDEALGKYYTKFCNDKNYDAEALAKFRQLYKQPVSAYVMVVGAGGYTDSFAAMPETLKAASYSAKLSAFKTELDKPIRVTFTLLGLDGVPMISKTTEDSFTKGATVFDIFKKVLSDNNMFYVSKGSYISSINGLAEKDYGSSSGWMYTVGNVFVNSYMNAQELSGGEDIVVMYVRDYKDANKQLDNNNSNNNNNNNGNNSNNAQNTDKNTIGNEKPAENQSSQNKQNTNQSGSSNRSDNVVNNSINKSSVTANTNGSKAGDTAKQNQNIVKTEGDNPSNQNENSNSDALDKNVKDSQEKNSTQDNTPEKASNKLPIIIGAAAAILLLALIVIFIVLKKRKDNDK